MKSWKNDFLIHTNFLAMITISLFYCCEKVLSLKIYEWLGKNETLFPETEDFYSHLNMEDITHADYTDAKRVCNEFEIKNLGEYRDLYFWSNTLLLL